MKYSPYEAMYGQAPRLPNGTIIGAEYFEEDERTKGLQAIREFATRPVITKKSRFKLGQSVLWKAGIRRNKLEPRLEGPFTITSCGPNNTYLLTDNYNEENPVLISGDKLKVFQPRQSSVGRRTVVPANQAHSP